MTTKLGRMSQTLCIRCGSEIKPSSLCELCKEPLIFTCTSCNYVTEEKVHSDCRNASELTKTSVVAEETPPVPYIGKIQSSSSQSVEEKEHDKNFYNFNPSGSGGTQQFWHFLITNWYNTYDEFLKNSTKIVEYWYDTCWKPWLTWPQQRQQKDRYKVNVE
jgi:hypothetical protein